MHHIGLPLVVKPTRGGSALGVAIVREPADLAAAMVGCFAYADTAMLEAFVMGTEVAVSVIQGADGTVRALPAVEIVPDSGVYDYASRYTAGTTEFFAPARLGAEAAEACARVRSGRPRTTRAAAPVPGGPHRGPRWPCDLPRGQRRPRLHRASLFPQAVEAAGLDLGTVFQAWWSWPSPRERPPAEGSVDLMFMFAKSWDMSLGLRSSVPVP